MALRPPWARDACMCLVKMSSGLLFKGNPGAHPHLFSFFFLAWCRRTPGCWTTLASIPVSVSSAGNLSASSPSSLLMATSACSPTTSAHRSKQLPGADSVAVEAMSVVASHAPTPPAHAPPSPLPWVQVPAPWVARLLPASMQGAAFPLHLFLFWG